MPRPAWSSTLRLPKSTFPPRPPLPPDTRCNGDLYEWQSRERAAQKAPPFVVHDGPPYANGDLHIGHALNKILKDMICRVKVQQGRRVVYVPGWDCHGLPIEMKALEEQRKKNGFSAEGRQATDLNILSAIETRRVARSLATKMVKLQMKSFKEWGIMADWDNAWKTMDKGFELAQLEVFKEMVKKGLIFRRYRPVYWSPSSRTALAESELEYNDNHVSTAAYIKFPVTNLPDALAQKIGLEGAGQLFALIWTTTPWTLPANRAIAFNKDLEYSVLKMETGGMVLVAKTRLPEVARHCFSLSDEANVTTILGSELEGAEFVNVLRGHESVPQPFFHADFVSSGSGTGLVHCAPGHGKDDYDWCTPLDIPADSVVNELGCFSANALPDNPLTLEGRSVLDGGSQAVLDLLGDKVLATHYYTHKYPYDWRTKLPVLVRATEQWFADIGASQEKALSSLDQVKFIPEGGRVRLESFVRGRKEWCISRQRAWGVPIPALYGEDGKAVLTEESIAHIITKIKERGIDAWWADAADDSSWILPGLEGNYRRGKDTMDVWFDSGSSWTQTDQQADIYLEGTDQHRGWFQSSLLTYVSASDREGAPFKTLITHGFTLDQTGRKMSKSIGNAMAPSQIMDGSLLPPSTGKKGAGSPNLGADMLRLWVASSDYTRDVTIGHPILKSNQAALLKYRMIIKMLLGSMHQSARTAPITKLDQMALTQLEAVMAEVAAAFDNFEFYKGINAINRWINLDVSAFYVEAMKDRLYTGDGGGVLEEIFRGLLRMLTPVTPSLVDEAWAHLPDWMKAENPAHPFHLTLNEPLTARNPSAAKYIVNDLPWIMNARAAIQTAQEEARKDKNIGSSLESGVVLSLPMKARDVFERYSDELASIFVVSSARLNGEVEGAWKYTAQFDVFGGGKGIAWVVPANDHKCPRCWRYVSPVQDELCKRCHELVAA
ncbi:tRNA synthetases class I-domain-containing protein [Calycina marina]|uniref:Isoleucine--tRNA ligase, mitochondrial n=1 Tax=Calycina marina TaxID=1763456 RepID=A0A9P8CJN9_9HELO|nr:tRNA synthetases class I-domain-containing protein [Calycina marina]